MTEIITKSDCVAIEPVLSNNAETERKGGLTVLAHKTCVIPAKVVFKCPSLDVIPGDIVYLNGDSISKADWNRKIYEIKGIKFVLAPIGTVLLVER
jgi:hypothetical protein